MGCHFGKGAGEVQQMYHAHMGSGRIPINN